MTEFSPTNEDARLQALARYAILDTAAEESFDRVTALTVRLFEVPIAVISLIDENRLWFKSCIGLAADSIGREGAFCDSLERRRSSSMP